MRSVNNIKDIKKPTRIEAGSFYTYLSEGCKLCRRGAKLVLFVTGLCPNSCFYCPISEERKGRDVTFANERLIKDENGLFEEINLMDAEGVAITGGEPLVALDKTLYFIKLLKKLDLHIHLYTSIPAKPRIIEKLSMLDEIRFHPVKQLSLYEDAVLQSKKLGIEVGLEIPALDFNEKIAEFVNKHEIFMNLNELEFSATNQDKLLSMGFEPGKFFEAKGCFDIAMMYLNCVNKFHYCTVLFKDKAQMRRRFIRMAMNHPDFYLVTRDGTVVCGFVEFNKARKHEKADIKEIVKILKRHGVKEFNVMNGGIEFPLEDAEKLHDKLKSEGLDVSIIERYPTYLGTVVEKTPL